jgi:hypothetical protein
MNTWEPILNAALLAKEQSLPILHVAFWFDPVSTNGARTNDIPDVKRERYHYATAFGDRGNIYMNLRNNSVFMGM